MEFQVGILSFLLLITAVSPQGFMGMEPIISPSGSGNGIHSVTNSNPNPNARPNGAGGAPNNPAMEAVQNPNRLAMAPFLGEQGRPGTDFSRPTNAGNPNPNNLINMRRKPPQPPMVVRMPHLCQTASWSTDSMVVLPMPMSRMKTAVGTLPLMRGVVTQQGRKMIPFTMEQIMMMKMRNQMMSMVMHDSGPMAAHTMNNMGRSNNMMRSTPNMVNGMLSGHNRMNTMNTGLNVVNKMSPVPEPIMMNNMAPISAPNMMNNMAPISAPNVMNNMAPMTVPNMMNNMAPMTVPNMMNNMAPAPEPNMMNNMAPMSEPNMMNNMAPMSEPNMMNNMAPMTVPNMMNSMAPLTVPNMMNNMAPEPEPNMMNTMTNMPANNIVTGMVNRMPQTNTINQMAMMSTSQNGGTTKTVWMEPSSNTVVAMSYPTGSGGANNVRIAVY
uniref:Uncharacterized protein n=1 Tax=Magallana gigas TaxID=29159 RepID=A0A8W8L3M9_MAGGI